MTRYPAAASAITIWLAGTISPAAGQPLAVDVRLNGSYAPDLVAAIANLGAPTSVEVRAGTSLRAMFIERCGTPDLAYVNAFMSANPTLAPNDLAAAPRDGVYVFPACARAPAFAPRQVRPGETVESIFRQRGIPIDARAIDTNAVADVPASWSTRIRDCLRGVIGTWLGRPSTNSSCTGRGFAATENASRFMAANPTINTRALAPGRTQINVPSERLWSTIVLRPGVTVAQASAAFTTASAKPGAAASAEVARASVATLVADTPIAPGSCTGAGSDWPFRAQDFQEAVERNARVRPAGQRIREAPVLVLDTGLDARFIGRAIPPNFVGQAMSVGGTSARVYSAVNLVTGATDAEPPANLPNRLHGSEVAALLTGGPLLENQRVALDLPVRMIIGSLATTTPNGSYLSSRGINEALRYAHQNDIPIINGSVFATENRQEFINALPDARQDVLLVTAAGNNGAAFDDENLSWPGALGGDTRNAPGGLIVSVGSHDSSGRLSSFSRFGDSQVDLLAPGCSVPTFSVADGNAVGAVDRSGTSFAAPIVSLVASMLYAEGLPPADIKARLIISVDVDPEFDTLVYSRGRLNVRKALSIWQDVVQYYGPRNSEGRRELRWAEGDLAYPNNAIIVCGRPILQSALRKLSLAGEGTPASPRYAYAWTSRVGGQRHELNRLSRCEASRVTGADIVIREAESSTETSIPIGDVIDFVSKSIDR